MPLAFAVSKRGPFSLCSVHPSAAPIFLLCCYLFSFDELEDGAVVIGDQVKQITGLKIELVPVAQRELEIQAATDFLEGYYVRDYLQLPQDYWVDQVFVVIST